MNVKGTVNRVELIGWLGGEPTQRFLPSGVGVCDFSVATKRFGSKDEQGEQTFDTEWTTIEAWNGLGDICQDRLHKGSRVRVVGSLHTRSWEDKENGQRRSKTVVRADEVLFLDAYGNDE
ncbi:MAG: single-stranded DNA-binding protein [Chloroflexi bacterium]|nr:single-stranded DNA-binding protein [Chloroflexota bacterium]